MATLNKEDLSSRPTLAKSPHSSLSSFINKYVPKTTMPAYNKTPARIKSKSISTKPPSASILTMSSPKSNNNKSPSPTSSSRINHTLQSDRCPESKSSVPHKDIKKPSFLSDRAPGNENPSNKQQSEACPTALDRYTFYSSDFSLFDAKTPNIRFPVSIPNGQNNLELPNSYSEPTESSPKLEPQSELVDNAGNKRGLVTSKSCKTYDLGVDTTMNTTINNQTASLTIPLKSPKTTKHISSSPVTVSHKYSDNFSSRMYTRNFSPLSSTHAGMKSPQSQKDSSQGLMQGYYLPNKKYGIKDERDIGILRSVSPTAEGLLKKDAKMTSYISKNPFLQSSSSEYGKYNRIFKGIQGTDLHRFMPENYKKLGKSYTNETSSKTLRENRLLNSKSAIKGSRNGLDQYFSYRETNSFQNTNEEDKNQSIEKMERSNNAVKSGNEQDIGQSENIHNISGPQTEIMRTCTSVEQASDLSSYHKNRSGRQSSIRDSDSEHKECISDKKRDSVLVIAEKEAFDEFFSSAMTYMCEVIVSKEAKSKKFEQGTHADHLDVLLDHILSESQVLKKRVQELSERVRIGKSLLILLEMMLRSVLYIIRRDYPLKTSYRNRSNEKGTGNKEKSMEQDYKVKFEEVCGLSGKEGLCDENERDVRDELCYEIQKRRKELEYLEGELREGNQGKILQYVQNIQLKIAKVLKDKRRSERK